jgi:hypothetical protein
MGVSNSEQGSVGREGAETGSSSQIGSVTRPPLGVNCNVQYLRVSVKCDVNCLVVELDTEKQH